MRQIIANEKYVITVKDKLHIYLTDNFKLLKDLEIPKISLFDLCNDAFVYCNPDGISLYNIKTGATLTVEKHSQRSSNQDGHNTDAINQELKGSSKKVRSIFIKESFIYVGYENGIINSYSFNDYVCKLLKSFNHPGPVVSIKSNNIKTYVVDIRDRLTMYPDNIIYDFVEPKLFFSKILYIVSECKVYACTKDAIGYLFEATEKIDDLAFSPKGGVFFCRSGSSISCYNFLGNQLGRFFAKDFAVISRNDNLFIVEDGGLQIKSTDTYLKDIEYIDPQFTKMNVKEVTVKVQDLEPKHVFVDDGNSKKIRMADSKKSSRKRMVVEDSSKEDIYEEYSRESGYSNDVDGHIKDNGNKVELRNHQVVPETLIKRNPSSFENQDGNLLYYSSQGYMIAVETPVSNQVLVRYHDQSIESIKLKDELKCRLGSFYGTNCVLSDGKTVKFNEEWSKPITCSLLGIGSKFIYAFDQCHLKIIDFSGKELQTIFIKDSYSFCIGGTEIAVFCKDFIMIITEEGADYIPSLPVDFGCYDGTTLYVKIGSNLYKCKNKKLIKVFDTAERILTVSDSSVITLKENTILPRPLVNFYEITPDLLSEIKIDESAIGTYNPYRI